ncbi:MAG: hypothetical protein PHY15_05910 [Eubacteriales bacterium]|nr:hypothetical protein [Eubacteriales bacterium]MDD4476301.1 hypothetical protein [Eubacteriales bacterium]
MRKISIFLLFTTIISFLSGCNKIDDQSGVLEKAPRGFAIHFETWIVEERKNVFNTYEGYIQKDLIQNGIEQKDYKITKADLDEIYRKIYTIKDIKQEMTTGNLSQDGTRIGIEPMTYYMIAFRLDGVTYIIKGDKTSSYYIESSREAAAFWEAVNFLSDFMQNTDVYKSMPAAVGGYD